MTPAESAVAIMRTWAAIKVRETEGPNRGPVIGAIQELAGGDDDDGQPWCARAVVAAWIMAGWSQGLVLSPKVRASGSTFLLYHGSAPELRATHPQPGDAMIRYLRRPGFERTPLDKLTRDMTHSGHVEIVASVRLDGSLVTIGGNTDSQDAREGDGVYVHDGRYRIGEPRVVGFVRPLWVVAP